MRKHVGVMVAGLGVLRCCGKVEGLPKSLDLCVKKRGLSLRKQMWESVTDGPESCVVIFKPFIDEDRMLSLGKCEGFRVLGVILG